MNRTFAAAVDAYLAEIRFREESDVCVSYSPVEIAKLAIADEVLNEMGLPTEARPYAELHPKPPTTPSNAAPKQRIPTGLRWEVWSRDDFRCQNCGSRSHLEVDHIMPESKGGQTISSNLQTLCRSCNASKGAKVADHA
jgi:hypothetical protein